jgi:hypothetical protein
MNNKRNETNLLENIDSTSYQNHKLSFLTIIYIANNSYYFNSLQYILKAHRKEKNSRYIM